MIENEMTNISTESKGRSCNPQAGVCAVTAGQGVHILPQHSVTGSGMRQGCGPALHVHGPCGSPLLPRSLQHQAIA